MDNNDIVIIELDRPREMRLSHKALKTYCAKTKVSLQNLQNSLQVYDNISYFLWCMLHADDPQLTPAQLDDLLDMVPMHIVMAKLEEAVTLAFGAPSQEGTAGTPPEAAGTGIEA